MRILLKERVVYMSSTTKINVPDIFASMVFNDDVMRERLPKDVYKSLRKTIDNGKDLDITVANAVANAMKDWAIEKGATHYTHWFQSFMAFATALATVMSRSLPLSMVFLKDL